MVVETVDANSEIYNPFERSPFDPGNDSSFSLHLNYQSFWSEFPIGFSGGGGRKLLSADTPPYPQTRTAHGRTPISAMQLPLWPRRSCLSLYVVLLAAVFLAPHSVHAAKAKKGGKSSKGKSGGSAGTTMAGSAGGAVGGVCDVPAGSSVEELLRAGSAAFGRDYAASENCYRLVLEKDRKNVLAVYNIGLGQMNQVAASPREL